MKLDIKRYAKRGLLAIAGDVNVEMFSDVAHIIEELLLLGAPDINVIIASGGGDTTAEAPGTMPRR